MRYLINFIFIVCTCLASFCQSSNSKTSNPSKSENSRNLEGLGKVSIYLETNFTSIFSQNSNTIPCYQGQLAVEYNLFSKFQIGLFGQTLLYHHNTDIANIDNKIIDLSSIEYNTLGLSTGYKAKIKRIIIYPKLDFGYNFFLAKSLDYSTDKKEFLDYRYFSVTPKLNLGYAISEGFSLGLNLGYNKQILALKGQKLAEFDPNSILVGISSIIILPK